MKDIRIKSYEIELLKIVAWTFVVGIIWGIVISLLLKL